MNRTTASLTWILIVVTTKKELGRFYGTFEKAKEYFISNKFHAGYDTFYLDIVSLSGKSGF